METKTPFSDVILASLVKNYPEIKIQIKDLFEKIKKTPLPSRTKQFSSLLLENLIWLDEQRTNLRKPTTDVTSAKLMGVPLVTEEYDENDVNYRRAVEIFDEKIKNLEKLKQIKVDEVKSFYEFVSTLRRNKFEEHEISIFPYELWKKFLAQNKYYICDLKETSFRLCPLPSSYSYSSAYNSSGPFSFELREKMGLVVPYTKNINFPVSLPVVDDNTFITHLRAWKKNINNSDLFNISDIHIMSSKAAITIDLGRVEPKYKNSRKFRYLTLRALEEERRPIPNTILNEEHGAIFAIKSNEWINVLGGYGMSRTERALMDFTKKLDETKRSENV